MRGKGYRISAKLSDEQLCTSVKPGQSLDGKLSFFEKRTSLGGYGSASPLRGGALRYPHTVSLIQSLQLKSLDNR